MSEDALWVIAICGAITYATRFGGYLILARFRSIPPRVDAALNAVPAAVMTTLVAPAAVAGGWREAIALALVALVSLRAGMMSAVFVSWGALIALRHFT